MDEPDFAVASFLLSAMGESTFLVLLRFMEQYAPDPATRSVTRLAANDEARHVAFAVAHLRDRPATIRGCWTAWLSRCTADMTPCATPPG